MPGSRRDRDETAVRQVLEGDKDAFRQLVERHQGPLFAYVGNLLGRIEDREDVVQEVFLTAYRRLATFDAQRAALSTWLFTIARNRCLNLIASAERRAVGEPAPAPTDQRLPEHVVAGDDLARRLDAALAALPAAQRSCFILARFVQLPYGEIAHIEGVEPGTVKSRVARVREHLRAILPSRSEIF